MTRVTFDIEYRGIDGLPEHVTADQLNLNIVAVSNDLTDIRAPVRQTSHRKFSFIDVPRELCSSLR